MTKKDEHVETNEEKETPQLQIEVQMFTPGGAKKLTFFDNPHRIHITAGSHHFTIRIRSDGVLFSARDGCLHILPKASNLILIRENDHAAV